MIYLQAKVKPEIVANVASNIGKLSGVMKTSINPRVKHLLAVEYDPNRVSGGAILKTARESGCSASLVGM